MTEGYDYGELSPDEFHDGRPDMERIIDNAKRAELIDPENEAELRKWYKNPDNYDIKGVDTVTIDVQNKRTKALTWAAEQMGIIGDVTEHESLDSIINAYGKKKSIYGFYRGAGNQVHFLSPDATEEENSFDPVSVENYEQTIAHEVGHAISYRVRLDDWGDATSIADAIVFKATTSKKASSRHHDQDIKDELRALSKEVRSEYDEQSTQSWSKYRDSEEELFADFVSKLTLEPDHTKRNAPLTVSKCWEIISNFEEEGYEAWVDGYGTVSSAGVKLLKNLLQGTVVDMFPDDPESYKSRRYSTAPAEMTDPDEKPDVGLEKVIDTKNDPDYSKIVYINVDGLGDGYFRTNLITDEHSRSRFTDGLENYEVWKTGDGTTVLEGNVMEETADETYTVEEMRPLTTTSAENLSSSIFVSAERGDVIKYNGLLESVVAVYDSGDPVEQLNWASDVDFPEQYIRVLELTKYGGSGSLRQYAVLDHQDDWYWFYQDDGILKPPEWQGSVPDIVEYDAFGLSDFSATDHAEELPQPRLHETTPAEDWDGSPTDDWNLFKDAVSEGDKILWRVLDGDERQRPVEVSSVTSKEIHFLNGHKMRGKTVPHSPFVVPLYVTQGGSETEVTDLRIVESSEGGMDEFEWGGEMWSEQYGLLERNDRPIPKKITYQGRVDSGILNVQVDNLDKWTQKGGGKYGTVIRKPYNDNWRVKHWVVFDDESPMHEGRDVTYKNHDSVVKKLRELGEVDETEESAGRGYGGYG